MSESITPGIVPVDLNEHVVTGRYRPHETSADTPIVEVIEIANSRLAHTYVEGGNPAGRIAVFSRLISQYEQDLRILHNEVDPEGYRQHIIDDLPK